MGLTPNNQRGLQGIFKYDTNFNEILTDFFLKIKLVLRYFLAKIDFQKVKIIFCARMLTLNTCAFGQIRFSAWFRHYSRAASDTQT